MRYLFQVPFSFSIIFFYIYVLFLYFYIIFYFYIFTSFRLWLPCSAARITGSFGSYFFLHIFMFGSSGYFINHLNSFTLIIIFSFINHCNNLFLSLVWYYRSNFAHGIIIIFKYFWIILNFIPGRCYWALCFEQAEAESRRGAMGVFSELGGLPISSLVYPSLPTLIPPPGSHRCVRSHASGTCESVFSQ